MWQVPTDKCQEEITGFRIRVLRMTPEKSTRCPVALVGKRRLAWNGLNYHDANCITFHRVKNFRTLTMADSPPDLNHSSARR